MEVTRRRTVSINKMWNSWIVCLTVWMSTMVLDSEQTPVFSPSLFTNPSKNSTCPANALSQAMQCTAKLTPLGMSGQFVNKDVPLRKALEDGCVQGHFFDALNCMERVLLDCRHDKSDAAHTLRTMMNVDNSRKAIIYFCTNIETYLSNLECIQDSLPDMSTCGREAQNTLRTQMQATQNIDSQMRFQCPFYSAAVDCAESTLMTRCNKEISTFVFTVMAGMEPPVCATSSYSISSKGRRQSQQRDEAVGGGGGDGGLGGGAGGSILGRSSASFWSSLVVVVAFSVLFSSFR